LSETLPRDFEAPPFLVRDAAERLEDDLELLFRELEAFESSFDEDFALSAFFDVPRFLEALPERRALADPDF
jgi:hypothetical protein